MKKRILSGLITLALLISLLGAVPVFADASEVQIAGADLPVYARLYDSADYSAEGTYYDGEDWGDQIVTVGSSAVTVAASDYPETLTVDGKTYTRQGLIAADYTTPQASLTIPACPALPTDFQEDSDAYNAYMDWQRSWSDGLNVAYVLESDPAPTGKYTYTVNLYDENGTLYSTWSTASDDSSYRVTQAEIGSSVKSLASSLQAEGMSFEGFSVTFDVSTGAGTVTYPYEKIIAGDFQIVLLSSVPTVNLYAVAQMPTGKYTYTVNLYDTDGTLYSTWTTKSDNTSYEVTANEIGSAIKSLSTSLQSKSLALVGFAVSADAEAAAYSSTDLLQGASKITLISWAPTANLYAVTSPMAPPLDPIDETTVPVASVGSLTINTITATTSGGASITISGSLSGDSEIKAEDYTPTEDEEIRIIESYQDEIKIIESIQDEIKLVDSSQEENKLVKTQVLKLEDDSIYTSSTVNLGKEEVQRGSQITVNGSTYVIKDYYPWNNEITHFTLYSTIDGAEWWYDVNLGTGEGTLKKTVIWNDRNCSFDENKQSYVEVDGVLYLAKGWFGDKFACLYDVETGKLVGTYVNYTNSNGTRNQKYTYFLEGYSPSEMKAKQAAQQQNDNQKGQEDNQQEQQLIEEPKTAVDDSLVISDGENLLAVDVLFSQDISVVDSSGAAVALDGTTEVAISVARDDLAVDVSDTSTTLIAAHLASDGSVDVGTVDISADMITVSIEVNSTSPFLILAITKVAEPQSEVVLELTAQELEFPFTDVGETDWFYEYVVYAWASGLMQGVGETEFAPGTAVTRAMVWTILARMDGQETDGGATWYEKAQSWAVENGISDGTQPMASVTREQLVTMLWRFKQYQGEDVSVGEDTNILSYDDATEISEYAISAMQWACGAGVINGTSATTLSPQSFSIRAQLATILARYV